MYYVAKVINDECAKYNCKQCTLFCPEPNTLMYNDEEHHAYVVYDRCKGCAGRKFGRERCIKVNRRFMYGYSRTFTLLTLSCGYL